MPTAREHIAAGTIGGHIYVTGGRQGLNPMVDALERYDPENDAWEQRSAMPTARAGIAGAILDGRLFVFGGEEVGEQVFRTSKSISPGRIRGRASRRCRRRAGGWARRRSATASTRSVVAPCRARRKHERSRYRH